ncbi:hypothetical protein JOF48_000870 [Arthrobacter stackebrandtii]|uniref:Uncharacterized protein n=1 Tax=Arthrobacter stackebrandtii TaxID=272161 RepID=A0ABS4YTF1_9MICC|nr:hypothetical protein [Arthrobacter stackebrandtii]
MGNLPPDPCTGAVPGVRHRQQCDSSRAMKAPAPLQGPPSPAQTPYHPHPTTPRQHGCRGSGAGGVGGFLAGCRCLNRQPPGPARKEGTREPATPATPGPPGVPATGHTWPERKSPGAVRQPGAGTGSCLVAGSFSAHAAGAPRTGAHAAHAKAGASPGRWPARCRWWCVGDEMRVAAWWGGRGDEMRVAAWWGGRGGLSGCGRLVGRPGCGC